MIELRRAEGAKPLIIGHRGAMGHAPENTMASFERGLALGEIGRASCRERV